MQNNNTEKIEITKTTAWALLERMNDWLEWIDRLDAETRRDVKALDELIRALDAEHYMDEQWSKRQAEQQASYQAALAKKQEGQN